MWCLWWVWWVWCLWQVCVVVVVLVVDVVVLGMVDIVVVFVVHMDVFLWSILSLESPPIHVHPNNNKARSFPGAKTINVCWACLSAQLTICAQKWRNFVCSSTLSVRFVLSQVFIFFIVLAPGVSSHTISSEQQRKTEHYTPSWYSDGSCCGGNEGRRWWSPPPRSRPME